ncbi:hypothetical protein CUM78_10455 [Enterococcus faecalis]|nr:hypothetical protein CUM78_10455 [Enterococcus faecalis]
MNKFKFKFKTVFCHTKKPPKVRFLGLTFGGRLSSLYFFLFFFVLHSMREHIIQFIGFWPSFIFVLILVPNLMLGVGHINHWYKNRS